MYTIKSRYAWDNNDAMILNIIWYEIMVFYASFVHIV